MAEKTLIPGLEGLTFRDRPSTRNRIIYSVEGHTKTGKSTFGLYGKPPIMFFDIDHRVEGVIDKFQEAGKVIIPHYVNIPDIEPMSRKKDEAAMRAAAKEYDDFVLRYERAITSSQKPGGVQTIVIDDITELYDLRLIAEFGRTQGIQQRDRGTANFEFLRLIDMGKDTGHCSVIWISKVKEEWKGTKVQTPNGEMLESRPTGEFIPDGYKKLRQTVQVALRTAINRKGKFEVEVVNSGLNAETNGRKYTEDDWGEMGPYAWISAEQKEDTIPQDWMEE